VRRAHAERDECSYQDEVSLRGASGAWEMWSAEGRTGYAIRVSGVADRVRTGLRPTRHPTKELDASEDSIHRPVDAANVSLEPAVV
jgi:hypothetical protein